MAGDEIVAEWLGNVYSKMMITTGTPQRLHGSSLRFRNVSIFNIQNSPATCWIGEYLAAGFSNRAQYLGAKQFMRFEFVDLYALGCQTSGSPASQLRILGTNNY